MRNLMGMKDDEEGNEITNRNTRATTTLFDPATHVNESLISTANQSQNPKEHNYARVLDMQLNPKFRLRRNGSIEQGVMDFD